MATDRSGIRAARAAEIEQTVRIEDEADTLLVPHLGAIDWPPSTDTAERAGVPGFVLVAEDLETGVLVGFVHVLEIDRSAHLEQVSVLPRFGGRGIGRMLVEAAKSEAASRGHRALTLRTYRDVPWNAPFYATCGFAESAPTTAFLKQLVDVETELGLDRYGARVQMTAQL